MFKKLASKLGLSEEEKDAIFSGTAMEVYGLPPIPTPRC
jgi:hypothetical protein